MVLAMVAGYLLALLVARLSGLYLGMATIAFALFLGVLAINGGELTGGPTGLYGALSTLTTTHVVVITLAGRARAGRQRAGIASGARSTPSGRTPSWRSPLGIDVNRIRRRVFVVSGALGRHRRRDDQPAALDRLAGDHRLPPGRHRAHDDHRRRRAVLGRAPRSARSSSPGCPACSSSWGSGSRWSTGSWSPSPPSTCPTACWVSCSRAGGGRGRRRRRRPRGGGRRGRRHAAADPEHALAALADRAEAQS